jgi:hypothetical protein
MRGVTKPVQLSCQWQDCVTTYFQLLTYRRVCNKVHTTAHIRQVARERFVRPQSLSQSSEAPRFDTPLREPALSGAEGYSYTQTATGTRRYLLTSSPANSTKGNSDFGLICRRTTWLCSPCNSNVSQRGDPAGPSFTELLRAVKASGN